MAGVVVQLIATEIEEQMHGMESNCDILVFYDLPLICTTQLRTISADRMRRCISKCFEYNGRKHKTVCNYAYGRSERN